MLARDSSYSEGSEKFDAWLMLRVGTKKMTIMDFHEILPLYQFNSESQEFLGYFYVASLVFTRQLI